MNLFNVNRILMLRYRWNDYEINFILKIDLFYWFSESRAWDILALKLLLMYLHCFLLPLIRYLGRIHDNFCLLLHGIFSSPDSFFCQACQLAFVINTHLFIHTHKNQVGIEKSNLLFFTHTTFLLSSLFTPDWDVPSPCASSCFPAWRISCHRWGTGSCPCAPWCGRCGRCGTGTPCRRSCTAGGRRRRRWCLETRGKYVLGQRFLKSIKHYSWWAL